MLFKRFVGIGIVIIALLSGIFINSFAVDNSLPLTPKQVTQKINAYYTALDVKNKGYAFWNKGLSMNTLIKQADAGNYAAAVSRDGCKASDGKYAERTAHNNTGKDCQSNHFSGITSGGIQCSGFADYIIYVIFGTTNKDDFYKANKKYTNNFTKDYEFYPGDLIRYDGHSMVVYKVEDGEVYFIECNYTGNGSAERNCIIFKGTHSIKQSTLRKKIVDGGYIMIPKAKLRSRVKPSVTAPVVKELIHTGSAQKLVTAGKVKGGTMYYALGKDNVTVPDKASFTTDIPKGTDSGTYYVWYKAIGDNNHTDTEPAAIKVDIYPITFTLPSNITIIEASVFNGDINISVVDAHNCTAIGTDAFKDCTGLRRIRLPQNCQIESTAFDGCGTVYVFAPANGLTQEYCQDSKHHCIFIAE